MEKYKKIAFLFPGQGAQYPGMAADFYEEFSVIRQTFEEASDLLKRDLKTIILNGPEDVLTETQNSQTAIYTVGVALLRVLNQQFPHIKPHATAGLSLGEYTALTSSNILSFKEGLQLVQKRGKFMNDACNTKKGTMAVILGLNSDQVEKIVRDLNLPQDLWTANFNCPGQVVVSGSAIGIEAASKQALSIGAKRVLPLNVFGAFHSGLMSSAEEALAPYIYQETFSESPVTIIMNVTGLPAKNLHELKENLIKQVTHSVRWEQSVSTLADMGTDAFIEFGPGNTLKGFNKKICQQIPTYSLGKIDDLAFFS